MLLLRHFSRNMLHDGINYSHAVFYILSIYLFYKWKFVPFEHLHSILLPPHPTYGNHKLNLFFCIFLNCFLDGTNKWDHMKFVLSDLRSLSMICLRSIHVVTNGRISSFLWLNSILLCVEYICIHTAQFFYSLIHPLRFFSMSWVL